MVLGNGCLLVITPKKNGPIANLSMTHNKQMAKNRKSQVHFTVWLTNTYALGKSCNSSRRLFPR